MDTDSETLEPALAALVGGRWSQWHGLAPAPSEADVTAALGAPQTDALRSGMFGGSPTMFHRYQSDAGPEVTVWFEDEYAVGIEIAYPTLDPDDTFDDAPDLVLESQSGSNHEQRVYAARGLAIHLKEPVNQDAPGEPSDQTGAASPPVLEPVLLFAIAPFEPDDFLHDPLRHTGYSERRQR